MAHSLIQVLIGKSNSRSSLTGPVICRRPSAAAPRQGAAGQVRRGAGAAAD